MQFYEYFQHLKNIVNKINTDEIIFGFIRNFFGNGFLFGLKSQMCINDVSMALLFEFFLNILVIVIRVTFYEQFKNVPDVFSIVTDAKETTHTFS